MAPVTGKRTDRRPKQKFHRFHKKPIFKRIAKLVTCGYTQEEAARLATEAQSAEDVNKLVAVNMVNIRINEFLAEENFSFQKELHKLDEAGKKRVWRLLSYEFTHREAIVLSQKSLRFMDPRNSNTPIPLRIVHLRYPYEDLVDWEVKSIKRWLAEQIQSVPSNEKPCIAKDSYHVAGYLLLICFNPDAVSWILDLMAIQPWSQFRTKPFLNKHWLQPGRETINNRIRQRLKKLHLNLYADENRNYEEDVRVRGGNQQYSNYFSGTNQLNDPGQLVHFIDQLRDEAYGCSGAGRQLGDGGF